MIVYGFMWQQPVPLAQLVRAVLVEEAGEHYAVVKFNGTEIGRQIFDIKVNKPVEKN
ncbi:hypothetical protein EfmJHP36_11970 [Enterococcus faecium]|nr:hypothetical protein EfmJHP36_11970 [Enterococcus faecium]